MNRIVALLLIVFTLSACLSTKHAFTKSDVKSAQKVIGLEFSNERIDTMYSYLERNLEGYDTMRNYRLENDVMPAILFDPLPFGFKLPEGPACIYEPTKLVSEMPDDDQLAFMTIAEQASLIKSGKLSSEHLTRIYLGRIKKYDPTLKAVITLMEEEALERARKADQEIRNGLYKGPLHGIPYGLKDLVAVKGYPTTWGAMPYKDQQIDETATIVKKLEEAGAILIAKLTSGALARGDVWFGGKTVSPWDTLKGASGSSAGSGSATAAGLVSFSIGTETLGSITSPSTRNGVTGLRPTYGRVSRTGVMPLSWSMDKVGPICRSAEDCILVFQEIQGVDPMDPTLYDVPFCYDEDLDLSQLKIGYLDSLFVRDTSQAMRVVRKAVDSLTLLGLTFISDSLPGEFPFRSFDVILRAEAGAFFDELVRSGQVDLMVEQSKRSRANSLRQSRFIPAVEYLQANRHRKVLIEKMHEFMSRYDVVVSPTFGGSQLVITNLTGHPVITFPTGLDKEGHPTSLTLIGNLFEEAKILKVAKAFQEATSYDEMHPPMFAN
ncbi:amidase [Portibacter marinus]|uniref:amidase n=1 Tax=Portibacter marinus TaxID=2898660 RepID=UPI001F381B35|nr:amidase [Portibacter marinus]